MLNVHDINKLAVGPSRVVYAPTSVAVPKKLHEIVELINEAGVYKLADDWIDFGAAPEGDGAGYSRGFETESLGIEQATGAIFTDITDVNRSISLNIAEIDPVNMKIVEGTSIATETIAKAKGSSAQERVPIGSVTEFDQYRVAILFQRKKQSGVVKEPDGTERGRLGAVVLNRCQISADDAEIEVTKGSLLSAALTLEGFPEPGEPGEKAYGGWIFESAGTIEAPE